LCMFTRQQRFGGFLNQQTFDSSTACNIAISIVHSKLDYCNSVHYYNSLSLSYHVSSRSRTVFLILTVVKSSKSCHITPILRSLHWLRITEHNEYKPLSLTYKVLTTTQPPYISVQRPRSYSCSATNIILSKNH